MMGSSVGHNHNEVFDHKQVEKSEDVSDGS